MRTFRHIYKPFLIILLAAMSASVCSAYDFTVNGYHFNFRGSDGEVVLKATIYNTIDTLYIPPTVQFRNREFKITKIEDYAFANKKIKILYLPEGLEIIGHDAFVGNAFHNLVIPNTVKDLGERAFANNPNLKTIQLGTSIPAEPGWRPLRYTFENCENIDTIILCTKHPIENINDYPAFPRMVKNFAKVFVPYNSIIEYAHSEWARLFSEPLIPYLPKGQKAETNAFVFINWRDEKIERKESFNCSYIEIENNPYTYSKSVETHDFKVTIESVPVNDITILRLTFSKTNFFKTHCEKSFYTIYEGQWNSTSLPSVLQFIEDPFESYLVKKHELTVDFNWFQKPQLFKSKLVPGCKFTLNRDGASPDSRLIYFNDTSATKDIITWPEKPNK